MGDDEAFSVDHYLDGIEADRGWRCQAGDCVSSGSIGRVGSSSEYTFHMGVTLAHTEDTSRRSKKFEA